MNHAVVEGVLHTVKRHWFGLVGSLLTEAKLVYRILPRDDGHDQSKFADDPEFKIRQTHTNNWSY